MAAVLDAVVGDERKKRGVPAPAARWKAGAASLARVDSRAWLNMGSANMRDMARLMWGPWMAEPPGLLGRAQRITGAFKAGAPRRSGRLFVPYSAKPGCPLAVMLHGCLQDAESFAKLSKMDQIASEQGFCVLYPDQDADAHPLRGWNWNKPEHQTRLGGEPEAIAALVARAQAITGAPPSWTGVAGVSAGGAMAATMAFSYPELFGAVATVAAPVPFSGKSTEEALREMGEGPGSKALVAAREAAIDARLHRAGPPRSLPMLVVHGLSDKSVDASHAAVMERSGLMLGAALGGSKAPRASWRLVECQEPGAVARVWTSEEGVAVASVTRAGLGHAWSGGSSSEPFSQRGFDQSGLIAEFFKAAREGSWLDFSAEQLARKVGGPSASKAIREDSKPSRPGA